METAPTLQSDERDGRVSAIVLGGGGVITEEDVQAILTIDNQIFPTMPIEEGEIRETLESKGVQIVLRDAESNTVGYVISLPYEDAYAFLSEYDPDLAKEIDALYVESIGILPKNRSLENFNQLWKAFATEARQRGFKKVTAHVRVSEGLSAVLQKRFGAIKCRTFDNWADFNEPFDYLEMELEVV